MIRAPPTALEPANRKQALLYARGDGARGRADRQISRGSGRLQPGDDWERTRDLWWQAAPDTVPGSKDHQDLPLHHNPDAGRGALGSFL